MDLNSIRNKIDKIDNDLFHLIVERLKLVKEVVLWKKKNNKVIFDKKREEKIIKEKRHLAESLGFSPDIAEEILRSIIAESHLKEKKFLSEDNTSPLKIFRKNIESNYSLLDLFHKISKHEKTFFFLESLGDENVNKSYYSFLGFRPKKIFAVKDNEVFVDGKSFGKKEDPIAWLENQFKPYQNLVSNNTEEGFFGGLVGHINYESYKYIEKSIKLNSHPDFYDIELGLFLDGLIYNRKKESLEYFFTEENREYLIQDILDTDISEDESFSSCLTEISPNENEIKNNIIKCKNEINKGNVFQILPTQKFKYDILGSTINFYKKLRNNNPSPNMFYLHFEDREIIGSSPELISKVEGKRIETYPIAGTRSRGSSPQKDALLSAEMLSSEKEVAEHLMLVDMTRNDLGSICEYGSVKVEELMSLKKFSHVQHLVSCVSGKLKSDITSFRALLKNFPMGTAIGTPRIEAAKILSDIEKELRGPYSGGVGYWSITGDLQFALAIRSFFRYKNKGFTQAGAGIVYDSVPEHEADEILKKSKHIRELL